MSEWKELNSRTLGVERSRIPQQPWTVLEVLQKNGIVLSPTVLYLFRV